MDILFTMIIFALCCVDLIVQHRAGRRYYD